MKDADRRHLTFLLRNTYMNLDEELAEELFWVFCSKEGTNE